MTSETTLREYVVTLHKFDDLESFYTDMETEGGDLYIPNREVDVALRRPVSRNTHYMLSDQEAEQLRQDSRVLAVELTPKQQGIEIHRSWTQTSSLWSKSDTLSQGQLNWGLLRVVEGQQRPNWGVGGTTEVTGTVSVPFGGKNVDVIIVDDTVDGSHPEFAKNADGTGGTRFVPFNWNSFDRSIDPAERKITKVARSNGIVTITTAGYHGLKTGATVTIVCSSNPSFNATNVSISEITLAPDLSNALAYLTTFTYSQVGANVLEENAAGYLDYPYSYTVTTNDYHGTHCAGIAVGNTQGWARDANIYNYDLFKNGSSPYDYIRVWHAAKPINPATGRKNPSIINASYIYLATPFITEITSINYRGTTTAGPFTIAQLNALGIRTSVKYNSKTSTFLPSVSIPVRNSADEADIADCIAAGVIIVSAAGNDGAKIDLPGGPDYDNTFTVGTFARRYNSGGTPGSADGVICTGAVGEMFNADGEEKAIYSNCGPRIDVFAPGSNIRSAVPSNYTGSFVLDSRNSNAKMSSNSGTSFSGPQVAGMIATILEVNPALTSAAALSYITSNAKTGQLVDTAANPTVKTLALNGAPNRYAFAKYPATISITASTTTATPLQTVIYTISIPDVLDGSLVYLTDSGTSLSTDFNDGVRQFVLTVNSGTASLTRTVSAGITGTRTSILQLRTGGYDGNIQSTASTVTVSLGDFVNNSGSFTVDSQGIGSFSITPRIDSVIEGAETFTISIRTGSVSGDVVKTSDSITINAST